MYGFINNSRTAPPALAVEATATEILLHAATTEEYSLEKAATGCYQFNACSEQIQDKYLPEADFSKLSVIWTTLQTKLQGDNVDSRSCLLNKFITMAWQRDMRIGQFAKKLITI